MSEPVSGGCTHYSAYIECVPNAGHDGWHTVCSGHSEEYSKYTSCLEEEDRAAGGLSDGMEVALGQ